jgi:hypothetical protein
LHHDPIDLFIILVITKLEEQKMSDGNAGAQLLRMLVKIVIFIIKLLPSLFKLIYRGIVAIINMFRKKDEAITVDTTE